MFERLAQIGRQLLALARRSRVHDDVAEEMQLHLELRAQKLRWQGMTDAGARAAARRRFGNVLRLREEAADVWGWRWLEDLVQDLRFAARDLGRHKAFAATAIVTLALGIGANAAIFSVVNGVVLRPLPFAAPERLVQMVGWSPVFGREPVSSLQQYRAESRSFDALAGYEVGGRYVRDGAGSERVIAARTELEFFTVLGVPPLYGRTYQKDDPPNVAVVSEAFWRRRLGADAAAVGRAIVLDDQSFTLVGIMPASFEFPYRLGSRLTSSASDGRVELWTPFNRPLTPRGRIGQVTGRLKAGVSLEAAQSELAVIAKRVEGANPENNRGRTVQLVPLTNAVVETSVRRPLFILLGAVGLVLALACANVTNMSLVRMTLRSRELATRVALGARPFRLVRQLLTESLLLSLVGGIVGFGLAWWATARMMLAVAARIPRGHEVGLDWRVFAFLFAVCTVVGVVAGMVPATAVLRRSRDADVHSVLQESDGRTSMGPRQRRVRDALLIAEVALAVVLGLSAIGLVRELVRLRNTDMGMTTTNVTTFHLGRAGLYGTDGQEFYAIANRVSQLPNVRAAGFTQLLPLQNWGWNSNSSDFTLRGQPPRQPFFPIELRFVTPGYFQALGIPIRKGRGFTDGDTAGAPGVVLINEALARRSFGDEDPVGKETSRGLIVGVVGDVRQVNIDRSAIPELYTPIAQNWSHLPQLGLTLVVSARGSTEPLIDAVRSIVREVNPTLAVFNVMPMDRVVDESLADFTLYLSLMAFFAAVALVLAATGTYGVISYIVASRAREFAIRVALGADAVRVTRLILRQGLGLTVIGLVFGLGAAAAATPLLRYAPITVRSPNMITIALVLFLTGLVALAACLIPARRAARIDPVTALRQE
jgi:putative ABC transport system permease protein